MAGEDYDDVNVENGDMEDVVVIDVDGVQRKSTVRTCTWGTWS